MSLMQLHGNRAPPARFSITPMRIFIVLVLVATVLLLHNHNRKRLEGLKTEPFEQPVVLAPKAKPSTQIVLVTGGLGFIGSHVVELLVSQGSMVVILDDESSGHNFVANKSTIFVHGDITKPSSFDQLPALKYTHVIHLAAKISVEESVSHPEKYYLNNVEGSRNVLRWAVRNRIKRVVSASSAAVYGIPTELPVNEQTKTSPLSPYADSKLKMEDLHREMSRVHGLSSVCLRFFNVYGPRQDPTNPYSGVISKLIGWGTEGKTMHVFGDGEQYRDFVYVKDIAAAVYQALDFPLPERLSHDQDKAKQVQIFNVGTGEKTTINYLCQVIGDFVGAGRVEHGPDRAGDIKESVANVTAIRNTLHWKSKVSLKEGIQYTMKWFHDQQKHH